nr:MAG TPA: hypothetical protein [Caudoviricetes sp.]
MWEVFRRMCAFAGICAECVKGGDGYGVMWYAEYVNRKWTDYGLRLHIMRLYVMGYMYSVLCVSA